DFHVTGVQTCALPIYDRAIRAAHALAGAHDHGVVDFALLHLAAGNRIPHADLDDITDVGITPVRTAEHLDALQVASAAVVGRIEECLHLDHGFTSALFIDNAAQSAARSTISTRAQLLRLDSGRVCRIVTRSPTRASLFSSCASSLVLRRTNFPY